MIFLNTGIPLFIDLLVGSYVYINLCVRKLLVLEITIINKEYTLF